MKAAKEEALGLFWEIFAVLFYVAMLFALSLIFSR